MSTGSSAQSMKTVKATQKKCLNVDKRTKMCAFVPKIMYRHLRCMVYNRHSQNAARGPHRSVYVIFAALTPKLLFGKSSFG